jgi:hypothetical protein
VRGEDGDDNDANDGDDVERGEEDSAGVRGALPADV